jgi:hypothetical protein
VHLQLGTSQVPLRVRLGKCLMSWPSFVCVVNAQAKVEAGGMHVKPACIWVLGAQHACLRAKFGL